MSDELFDITFSGQIISGQDLDDVKQSIAFMFKADAARIEQMFSGHRVVIKRQLDEATAAKYRGAFEKAGAICEVRPVSQGEGESNVGNQQTPTEPQSSEKASSPAPQQIQASDAAEYVSKYPESDQIPQALLTEPLGISGDDIADLSADIAPVGSPMQHHINEVAAPQIDTSGFDVAPVGSVLTTGPEKELPPPPDTTGLTMAD